MIEFRDQYAKEHGWNLIVESNMEAFNAGVGPFTHGSKVHTDLMKTQALLHGLDKYRFDAAFGGARNSIISLNFHLESICIKGKGTFPG